MQSKSRFPSCARRSGLRRSQRSLGVESLENRRVLSGSPINVDTFADVVDPDDGVTSIQEALDVAAERDGDDTVQLPGGTYAISDQLEINDTSGKVTIQARGRATIDAQGANRVLNIVDSVVELKRLNITGGFLAPSPTPGPPAGGGGINAERSDVVLKNTVVSHNFAPVAGGIRVADGSNVTLHRSRVNDNTAGFGGGGIGGSGGVHLELHHSVVKDNAAFITGGGIALGEPGPSSVSNSLEVDRSIVAHNSASTGGGISLGNGNNSFHLSRSFVYENTATGAPIPIPPLAFMAGNGGGIAVLPQTVGQNSITFSHSIVMANSSANSGGGIWNAGDMVLEDSLILRNSAEGNGGGVLNYGGSEFFHPGSIAIEDRSFVVGNKAGNEGGGIYNEEGGTLSSDLVFSVFGNNPDNVFGANV